MGFKSISIDNIYLICYNFLKDNKDYKMTTTVGIRDLVRNSNILEKYDYVDIEDRRTQKYKGLFVSPKYADEFKAFLKEKISKQKQEKLNRIMKYAGSMEVEDRYKDLEDDKIMAEVAKAKHG